jgi:hypothetical protein
MASNMESATLIDFASAKRELCAWIDELPDDLFNQIWDALHTSTGVGPGVAAKWLQSLGYSGATAAKLKTVMDRERRP